ncbi:DUF3734 domain-containing protein [Roseomonas sp. CCTCC AB2023176]|uniref:DUF3734 domain-containing protein n=1 Tax=Roseomonas sp. CCTCC AB2023176 TaxID=3342640 RepID=UPI0035DBD971
MTQLHAPARPASYDKAVALVLQGGGALGSYQAGVYEALASTDYLPDWVAGISIGAVNAAIIAGNPVATRVERLRSFWEGITAPQPFWPPGFDRALAAWTGDHRALGAWSAMAFGQPGFFSPLEPLAWLQAAWAGTTPTSYYDTSALRSTLERLIDFDRINSRETRLSVGAVNVRTGNFAYFDSAETVIRPEHIMASGALPPGFPTVEIDGEHYWDGGLVSNTPLQYVIDTLPRRSRLTFQVDVFPARGPLPTSLTDAQEREKDIRFSSRTRAASDMIRRTHDARHTVNMLLEKLPPELRALPEAEALYHFGCVTTMDIVQLIYRPEEPQGQAKDYEFSRRTMEARWAAGFRDAGTTLAASPWLVPMPPEIGARTFDVPGEAAPRPNPPSAEKPAVRKAA